MTPQWRLVACTLVGAAALGQAERASAIELLTYGDFEIPPIAATPEVPSWTLEEYRTADPSILVDSAGLAGFADNPIDPLNINADDRGLWIKPFAGSVASGTVEAILSQSVAAIPGKEYSFTGDARFEANYGGTAGFSTDIFFELAFLDAGGAVIGSPLVRDLESEVIAGLGWTGRDGNPDLTPLVGIAPANAASVRVQMRGTNMTSNTANSGQQSAFVDNFSLVTTDAPSTELLANAALNVLPPVPPTPEEVLSEFWDFIEVPDTSIEIVRVRDFANNPATGGVNGIWISPFDVGGQGGSGTVSQTVAGTPGTEYTFSAGARWEPNFVGDASLTDENKAVIELAFLDGDGEVISSSVLDLRDDGKTAAANSWTTHSVTATAPAGTVDVRVAGIISNLTNNSAGGAQSAFWDDFSLMAVTGGGLDGDYNSDGVVDAADYTVWRDGNSPDDSQAGYDLWAENYGRTSAPSSAVSVPEPTAVGLLLVGVAAVATGRRVG